MIPTSVSHVARRSGLLLLIVLLSGCGGGSDSGPGGSTTPAPTARASVDQTVPVGSPATLDGSASESQAGLPLSYQWTLTAKPSGSSAFLTNPNSVRSTFTPDVPGTYTASLVVRDVVASQPDSVSTMAVTGNVAPVSNAGPDSSAAPGRAITLDGTASRDANGTAVTYSWRIVEQPPGSNPTLTNPTAATPTFTADAPGKYVIALTCSDGSLTSPADQVVITVDTGNLPPVANAGPDQTVTAGQLVTLNGTGSSDPNGDALTYNWCLNGRPQGSTAALSGANTAQPTFTPDIAGSYVFCLTVNDGKLNSAPDTVVVEASARPVTVPTTRQSPRLQGRDAQGGGGIASVAVSADGNTVLIGGPDDVNDGIAHFGAAWVFTRNGSVWTQEGPKLVGTGAVHDSRSTVMQGNAVALSADGNTALVGGIGDNMGIGAAWVFIRTAGVWTQQGSKLVGDGAVGPIVAQGMSVALSADGNTAAIGAPDDNANTGAVWIFTRAGGVWTQQAKVTGTGNAGPAGIGFSVALSNDGTTLVTGGPGDAEDRGARTNIGAAWVFTRNGNVWTQQGPKLVGTGAVATNFVNQGSAVALSGDGNTVLIGADGDSATLGAAWVFVRVNGVWTQQGPKLEANDELNTAGTISPQQGRSVALSDDGNIALIGGPGDNLGFGAAWFFTRTAGVWTQQGSKIVNPDPQLGPSELGTSVALSADATTAVIGDMLGAWAYVP